MRADRIKEGFRRIGLVIAVACLLPAALLTGAWLLSATVANTYAPLLISAYLVATALISYLLARALGWIAAGFAGDSDPGST